MGSKSTVIESLTPCFPNAGTSTVIGAHAAPAMDARSVNDITGSVITEAAGTTNAASNSPAGVFAGGNAANNNNNWSTISFNSDDFFDQFLGKTPSAAMAA